MIGLTRRQNDCFQFLKAYIAEHGISPSFPEITAGLNLKSQANVQWLVRALEDRGVIKRAYGKRRSIAIVQPCEVKIREELFDAISAYARDQKIPVERAVNEAVQAYLGEG